MSSPTIYQLPTPSIASTGIFPNFKFMVCGDDLSTITTPGYLNQLNLQSTPISPSDVLQVLYSYSSNSESGAFGIFTVSIDRNTGLITLSAWADSKNTVLLSTFSITNATTTNFTLPDNALYVDYLVIAGAGGGGGFADNGVGNIYGGAGGGGTGAFAQGIWTVGYGDREIPFTSFSITVGAGGTGGSGAANGGAGGNVVFTFPDSSETTVLGGQGGAGAQGIANTAALIAAGGAGGAGVTGDNHFHFSGRGSKGADGFSVLGQVSSGAGASSSYMGGGPGIVNTNSAGNPGLFGGAAGGGACGTTAGTLSGGAGATGLVVMNIYGVGP